jgi:hypothetical protein
MKNDLKIEFTDNENEIEQSEIRLGQFTGNFFIAFIIGLLADAPSIISGASFAKMFGFFAITPVALLIMVYTIKIFDIRNKKKIIYLTISGSIIAMFSGFYFWMGRGNGSTESGTLYIIGLAPATIFGLFLGLSIASKIAGNLVDTEQESKNKISLRYAIYFGLLFFLMYDVSSLMFLPAYITAFKSSFSNFVLTRYIGDIVAFTFGYIFGKFIFKYSEKMTSFTEVYKKITSLSFAGLLGSLLAVFVFCILNFYAYHATIYILVSLVVITSILSFLFFVSANFLNNLIKKTLILLIVGLVILQLMLYFFPKIKI